MSLEANLLFHNSLALIPDPKEMWIAISNLVPCPYIHWEWVQLYNEKMRYTEVFLGSCSTEKWNNTATAIWQISFVIHCSTVMFLNNHCCLINKRTFSYHSLYVWDVMYLWLSVLLALSSLRCTGVILVSALGCNQASHSEQSESHWTRQKCSSAPANTLPPWPSVDGPFLLWVPPFSLTRVLLRLSEMSAQ